MPSRPAHKGIHESMGVWTEVWAVGGSSMDALLACAQGHRWEHGRVDGSLRCRRFLHGCPVGLRARASMRAWWAWPLHGCPPGLRARASMRAWASH